jgi:carbonic anhydrase
MSALNIASDATAGACDLKCRLAFAYQPSATSVASNNKTYIKVTYDAGRTPPVTYNGDQFEVQEVLLYAPSIHRFNGALVAAEFVVSHFSNKTSQTLQICLPVLSGSATDPALAAILAASGSAQGSQLRATIDLQKIVPSAKPFFTATDSNNVQWIIFDKTSALTVSAGDAKRLTSIIVAPNYAVCPSGPRVFLNAKGANTSGNKDGIYIDCQPTGSSEETTDVTTTKTRFDVSDSENIQYALYIAGILLLVVVVLVVLYYASGYARRSINAEM